MPTPLTYSGAPIPNVGETNDTAAILLAFGVAIDDKLNLKATSQSNRDTLYANVSKGTVVTCVLSTTSWIQWVKLTDPPTAASWGVLAERGTAVTSGVLTAQTGFSVSSQSAQRINGVNWILGRLTYSGSDVTASTSGGNISDIPMATVQTAWLPGTALTTTSWLFDGTAGNASARLRLTSGTLSIDQMAPGATLTSGLVVAFNISFPGA